MSERKLQQCSATGFIRDKERAAFDLYFRTPSSMEVAMRFSRDCGTGTGAEAASSASFSKRSPAIFSAASSREPRPRSSPRANPRAVPVVGPKRCRVGNCARSMRTLHSATQEAPMCNTAPRDGWLPIALAQIIIASNSAKSAWSASRRCAFRAGANRACGTTSGRTRRCSSILLTGEAGGRRCSLRRDLAGFEFVE
ncbi:hypothetical protein ACVWW5_002721 [Bradyrhizobium sp. LM3.4]